MTHVDNDGGGGGDDGNNDNNSQDMQSIYTVCEGLYEVCICTVSFNPQEPHCIIQGHTDIIYTTNPNMLRGQQ